MADVDDDLSASTARFRAFAEHTDDDPPASWKRAPRSRTGLLAVVVVVIVVLAVIVALLLAH